MQFFDSHCHLHDSRITHNLPEILDRAARENVHFMVTCATMEENFEQTAVLSQCYSEIIPSFGIHPWFINSLTPQWKAQLEAYLLSVPSGVGEIGLDFVDKKVDRDRQVEVFEHQLALAIEMERPVNIHVRKAWDTLIHILKRFGNLRSPGLVHSYSGSADMIPVLEKFGLYISFSGSVTNLNSKKVLNSLKAVSNDRLVVETDTPDIPPYLTEKRSKALNEPANLPDIAKIAARRLGMDPKLFLDQVYMNSLKLFDSILKKEE